MAIFMNKLNSEKNSTNKLLVFDFCYLQSDIMIRNETPLGEIIHLLIVDNSWKRELKHDTSFPIIAATFYAPITIS